MPRRTAFTVMLVAMMTIGLMSAEQKVVAPDPDAGDEFGFAVAIDGDTLVIGDPADDDGGSEDQGAAYVFVLSQGLWTLQQKLLAGDGAADDAFGFAVAITGDTIVVGARGHDDVAGVDQGAAYVFVRSGGQWTQQQKLLAAQSDAGDQFGIAVAAQDDTIVVGAAIGGPTSDGSASIFLRNGGIWTEQQELLPTDTGSGPGDMFGAAVAISGDTVVVGALGDDGPAGADQGSAYVFVRSGNIWIEQQKLVASNPAATDVFGNAVSISGETVVIGAFQRDRPGGFDQGSAFVFVRNGNVWIEQQELLPADPVTHDEAGYSVAISGDIVVVSVDLDDGDAGMDQGSAAVFVRDGGVWTETRRLRPADAAPADQFGFSVAIDGKTIVVGATQSSPSAGPGAAYIFTDTPPTLTLNAPISLWPPNHKYHTLTIGEMVASALDDWDGDLTSDVVVEKVTSDEPDDAPGGDGHTTHDILIAGDCGSVQVRAERNGASNGRVYAITLRVVDSVGGVTHATFAVRVPHDKSGAPAIEDAPVLTVLGTCP